MAAATTDKLDRVTDSTTARPVLASLATPGKAIGASSITCNNLTNWTTTTKIHFSIYNLTNAGVKDPTTQTDWTGIVSGNTLTNLTLTGGTDMTYSPGAIVDPTPTAAWAKDLYDNISGFANQNGTLQTAAVQAALNIGNVGAGWTPLGFTFSYGSNNGNKEFTVTTPNNLLSTISVGMKMSFARNTTPPTQCMAFTAASSQYATKSSPSGITFTGAFTCEAWVYLNSYTGSPYIVNRFDNAANGGWALLLNGVGQPEIIYGNGTNITSWVGYQSLPLKTWVHLAGAVTSVSSKTGFLYINGVQIPTNNNNSAATTMTQGTLDLRVGAAAGTPSTTYLDGYLSEVRVWATGQSQATIQSNMAINCVGTESNLVALFQGNGNFNDLTTNANNLTANGGAVATQSNNPYNATEYGVVTNISYSNPTTTLTIFTGTQGCIPNQTLSSAQFSTTRSPYGFPTGRDKWVVTQLQRAQQSVASPTNGTYYNLGSAQISIPTGEWRVNYEVEAGVTGASGNWGVHVTLSTANNSESDINFGTMANASAVTQIFQSLYRESYLTPTAQTLYYLNSVCATGSATAMYNNNQETGQLIRAECLYV